jgi:hypothetical protein
MMMGRAAIHKFIRKDQSHSFPDEFSEWDVKKSKIAKPFADLLGLIYLDSRIRKKIHRLKKEQPALVIGETHCHSNFSDGSHSVQSILNRASWLGLDYVVVTDHLIPGKFLTESLVSCLKAQAQCINEWEEITSPVEVYPAFEISTLEGHLILLLDQEYFCPKKISDISIQFSDLDRRFVSMFDIIPRIEPLGGISIIPHPNKKRAYPFGASIEWVRENLVGLVDGIEDISTGHGYREAYSEELGLASIGSSDDHFNLLMGTAVTSYDGGLHSDLISAVKSKQTKAILVENSLQSILAVARHVYLKWL